jgi:hypothetical protein
LEDVVLIVSDDRAGVEADLAAGRLSARVVGWACWEVGVAAGCGRSGPVRGCGGCGLVVVVVVRRVAGRRMCCCPICVSARRRYLAEVIGAALLSAGREGYRRAGERLGVPGETVRDWRARFGCQSERIAGHFVGWGRALDGLLEAPAAQGSPVADALEAIGVCTRVASLVLGRRAPWSWVSALTAGGLLAINTSTPWPVPE